MALAISSAGEQLLHISDTVLYPIQMEQPDWYPAFDSAPEQAGLQSINFSAGLLLIRPWFLPFIFPSHVLAM
jgi:hypothetical protein